MKCVICHGGDLVTKDVKEEFAAGNDLVLVPIRVPVCQTCGERYYDRQTMRFLEEAEREFKEGRAQVRQVGKVLIIQ